VRHIVALTVGLMFCLTALPAFAQVTPDVKKYLSSAAALFEKLEYEKALAQVKRAKKKSAGPEDDAQIALYEGIVLAEMGDAQATNTFTLALGMDPKAQLPMVVSPKVQRVFDKARASVNKVLEAQAAAEAQRQAEARAAEAANKPPEPVKVEPVPEPTPVVVIAPPPERSTGAVRKFSGVPAAAGVVAVGVGTVFLVQANGAHGSLVAGSPSTQADAQTLAAAGKTQQTVGWALVGVGAAAVAAGVVMFAVGGSSDAPVSASALVTPQGAAAMVSVRLP